MMYSEILDFHNVDEIDGSQFLGTPLTGPTLENADASNYQQPPQ
jgi:p38 MAP kinase